MEDSCGFLMTTCMNHVERITLWFLSLSHHIADHVSHFFTVLTKRLLIRSNEHQIPYLPLVSNEQSNERPMKACDKLGTTC